MEFQNKATALWSNFFNVSMVQIRTFHMTWFAFFSCFFAWFGIAPLMSVVRDELQLTKDQAEQAKREPTRVRRLSELHEAYDPMFARLTDEVQRSLDSFHKETGMQVSRILGVGGGFRLHGLLKYLRNGP